MNYRRVIALWGPVALYMAAIFYLSSLHQAPLPPGVSDKPAHSFGYLGLGLVIARALARGVQPRITLRQALKTLGVWAFHGAKDPVADWYADSLGAAIALFACWAWGIISTRSVNDF